jgi:integrase
MSVRKPRNSSLYTYDFQRGGNRFHGSTGESTKAAAEAIEKQKKVEAEEKIRNQKALKRKPMTIDIGFGRFWDEVGQHAASAGDIEFALDFACGQLGKHRQFDEITDNDIAQMVAARRKFTRFAGKDANGKQLEQPIAHATVNRTTQIIRRVFQKAARSWKVLIPDPPNWTQHFLPEPEERVREARFDEEDKMFDAARDDYRPIMEMAKVSALRMRALLLTWPQVDWENRQIRYRKKRRRAGEGDVWRFIPISETIEAILRPLIGHHETAVFTYVCQRTRPGLIKGQRYPITFNGLKTRWRRDRKESGVTDFRWHDWRHTCASRTARSSKNLGAVQKLLGHEKIETTMKYAHVLKEDIENAIETTARDVKILRESRGNLRGTTKETG